MLNKNTRSLVESIVFTVVVFLLVSGCVWAFMATYAGGTTQQAMPTPSEPAENPSIDMLTDYILSKNRKTYPGQARLIAETFVTKAEEYSLPFEYLVAMSEIESSFRTNVVSSADCVGLLQINPAVWIKDTTNKKNLVTAGVLNNTRDLYDPAKNIAAGAYILNHYIEKAKSQGVAHPVKQGVIRYCGLGADIHFEKFRKAMGDFQIARLEFSKLKEKKEAVD